MNRSRYCPWCHTSRVIRLEEMFFCPACQARFNNDLKKILDKINENLKEQHLTYLYIKRELPFSNKQH